MATNKFKNGNLYIIIYSVVMVVVVAVLLSVTAMSLQSRQNANVLNEKKNAILQSLGKFENGVATEDYDTFVDAFAVDADGNVIEGIGPDAVIDMLFDLKGAIENKTYPVFKSADGRFVFPVTGNGLWDVIWGYVALEADLNTISGIALDHKGETPGLGAEIATPKHQALYKGKKIFEGTEFVSVTLVKGGAKPSSPSFVHEVDAITGGTKTSDGVTAMLKDCLKNYLPYIVAETSIPEPAEEESESEELSNE
ncbi:MAG: FMN-binding protein [Alistipes sp.]|nr:FMN-binding protein [Alistipes sp.]